MDTINTFVDDNIKICILDTQTNFNIDVKKMSPNFPKEDLIINDAELIYEDRYYKFEIYCKISYKSITLIIDDDVKFEYNSTEEKDSCIKTSCKNYFAGLYDLTRIIICIKDEDDELKFYHSDYFRIYTNKVSTAIIEQIIDGVFNYDKELLECIFSTNYRNINSKNKRFLTVNVLKQVLEEFLVVFKRNYNYFRVQPRRIVVTEREMLDACNVTRIDCRSVYSIFQDMEGMEQVNYKSEICINGKYYAPRKIVGIKKEDSYDVYENKIVVGFIGELNKYIIEFYRQLEEQYNLLDYNNSRSIQDVKNVPSKILEELSRKRLEDLLYEIKLLSKEYEKIYSLYSKTLRNREYGLTYKPKYTDVFRSIKHYREIFELIMKFFTYKDYEFSAMGYMLGFKSLHTIYEYYCLIKLLEGYKNQGYQIISNECYENYEKTIYDLDINENKKINNTFYLKNFEKGEELTLYYHPKIYSKQLPNNNGITLLRRDGNSYYEPDYLLKYNNKDKPGYLYSIMDAKFSSVSNAKSYYLDKLIYKYLVNIGDRESRYSTVINLTAICLSGNKDWNLQSNSSMHCIPKVNLVVFSPEIEDKKMYNYCEKIVKLLNEMLHYE